MKSMELGQDPRLARILKTRGILFSIQGVAIGLFAFYIMIANGFALAPVFFPIYNVIFLGVMILLIVSVERIFFFRLCITYGKRSGAKFLIAKKRYRGSIALIVVAAAISFMLVLLTFTPLANINGNARGQVGTVEFQSNDAFALNTVNSITIRNLGINNLTFVVVTANDYFLTGANESALQQLSLNPGNNYVSPGGTTTAEILVNMNVHYFIVIFSNTGTVSASYIIGMKAMPSLFYAMMMAFAAIPISGYLAGYAGIQMKHLRPATIFA